MQWQRDVDRLTFEHSAGTVNNARSTIPLLMLANMNDCILIAEKKDHL